MQHFGSLLNVFWGKLSHPLKSCLVQLTFGEDFLKHPPVLVLWIPVLLRLVFLGSGRVEKSLQAKLLNLISFWKRKQNLRNDLFIFLEEQMVIISICCIQVSSCATEVWSQMRITVLPDPGKLCGMPLSCLS